MRVGAVMVGLLMMLAVQGGVPFNPAAAELFERDPVLNGWALASHDRNRDGWLTTFEAQAAAAAFKELADADRDGRVTVREFDEARRFIVARAGAALPTAAGAR